MPINSKVDNLVYSRNGVLRMKDPKLCAVTWMNLIPISESDKTQWGETFVMRLHKVPSIVLEVNIFGRDRDWNWTEQVSGEPVMFHFLSWMLIT